MNKDTINQTKRLYVCQLFIFITKEVLKLSTHIRKISCQKVSKT